MYSRLRRKYRDPTKPLEDPLYTGMGFLLRQMATKRRRSLTPVGVRVGHSDLSRTPGGAQSGLSGGKKTQAQTTITTSSPNSSSTSVPRGRVRTICAFQRLVSKP